MRRREFSLLGCLLVGLPLAARAQQSAKIARIGWMSRGNASAPDGNMNAFRQGMRELGYTEGQGFVIEPRYAALRLTVSRHHHDRQVGSELLDLVK